MVKNIARIFVYLSIIFLVLYLIRQDKFERILISNYYYFILSIVLLFLSFLINPFRWWLINRFTQNNISFKLALKSTGYSIFGKYIPGKVWMAFGKASIVAKDANLPIEGLLNNSFYSQILGVVTGLLFGLPFLFSLENNAVLISYFVLLGPAIFVVYKGLPYHWIPKRFSALSKKFLALQKLSYREVNILILLFLAEWLVIGIGFIFLTWSFSQEIAFNIQSVALFPFSSVIGILAVFTPGGLGVREGFLVYLFSLLNLAGGTVISITTISRLWFLCGEVFIFIVGFIVSNYLRLRKRHAE